MEFSEKYPWAKVFNIQESDFKKWQEEGQSESFILWSLKNKLLDGNSYLEWSKDHYQIPRIKNSFVDSHSLGESQWKRVKDLEKWKEDFVPLWEEEGAVYVGCLEPSKDTKNHRFVLADWQILTSAWKRVNSFEELKAQDLPEKEPLRIVPDEEESQRGDELPDIQLHQETQVVAQQEELKKMPEEEEKIDDTRTARIIVVKQKNGQKSIPLFFKDLDSHFLGMVLFRLESGTLIPENGKRVNFAENEPITYGPKNFLDVAKKGQVYNGFVINNESNKKLFENIGWQSFPKYVTVIPLKNKDQVVEKIFLGISSKFIGNKEVEIIQNTILSSLNDDTKIKIAA